MSNTADAPASDERIKQTSALRKALIRPELGGICGTVIVFVLFAIFAAATAECSIPKAFSTGPWFRPSS